MNTDNERKTAIERVEVFRSRYRQFGEEHFPLQIALRWQRAVESDPIDFSVLKEIFDSAKARRGEFDISFFTFCNHMESVVRDRLRDSFK